MWEFNAATDVLLDRLGRAEDSHPAESRKILEDLRHSGVDIVYRVDTLAYSPIKGEPGRMILDPVHSLAALKHEYRHFCDHRMAGYPGLGLYLADVLVFARLEVRGYLEEVKVARETSNEDLVPVIVGLMKARVAQLLGSN
jgi:DNA-binding transcriptional LysR family regulator